jgi:hypothetical protein
MSDQKTYFQKEIDEITSISGIPIKALRNLIKESSSPQKIGKLLFGDLRDIVSEAYSDGIGTQSWASKGKRFVQLDEVREVYKHLARYQDLPNSRKALILTSSSPIEAVLCWTYFELANEFIGFEENERLFNAAWVEVVRKGMRETIHLNHANCFSYNKEDLGVIDLDFCNNILRIPEDREKLTSFLCRVANPGVFILRLTLNIGLYKGNSKEQMEDEIEDFENRLREKKIKIRAKIVNQYQSTVPMMSLVWVLKKRP